MAVRYTLGIDVGTTAVKVLLISEEGQLVKEVSRGHDLYSEHSGWAEEDPSIWWSNVTSALREISESCKSEMELLCGIGVSGMVPAIVFLDKNGNVLRRSIQQNDARALEEIEEVRQFLDQDLLFEQTGGYTNQQHILPRILWVKHHEPEVIAHTAHILGSYDYIVYRLTKKLQTEINWAVESGSYDIRKGIWIKEPLEAFGFDSSMLLPVHQSTEIVGTTQGLLEFGIPNGIPVVAGSADHVASALAAGIVEEGNLLIKFGGAGDILYCVDRIDPLPNLFFDYHDIPNEYLLNGCTASSGSLLKWLTREIFNQSDENAFRKLDGEADNIPAGSDGLIILPYFLGEKTPLFDPEASGVMFGLRLSHTKAHIYRAVMEAVVYSFRHHIEVIEEAGYYPHHVIATDGGAKSEVWCQIAADVLGKPVRSYPAHPGSALGTAFIAGMSTGVFTSWSEITDFLDIYRDYLPNEKNHEVYNRAYAIYRKLYKVLKKENLFEELNRLY